MGNSSLKKGESQTITRDGLSSQSGSVIDYMVRDEEWGRLLDVKAI